MMIRILPKRNIYRKGLSQAGFTLIELLVTMAIAAIVIAAISLVFRNMSRTYTTQNANADLQQSLRAVVDFMAREIRMAGFTSLDDEVFGITQSQSSSVSFTVDWDDDGKVTASHTANPAVSHESDKIRYNWVPAENSLRRVTAFGSAFFSSQTLLGGPDDPLNVTGLIFSYLDENDDPTSVKSDIRTILITLTAQAPAGRDGMVERTYVSRVRSRNLGI